MWPMEAKWRLEWLRGWADAGRSLRPPREVQDQWGAGGRAGRKDYFDIRRCDYNCLWARINLSYKGKWLQKTQHPETPTFLLSVSVFWQLIKSKHCECFSTAESELSIFRSSRIMSLLLINNFKKSTFFL